MGSTQQHRLSSRSVINRLRPASIRLGRRSLYFYKEGAARKNQNRSPKENNQKGRHILSDRTCGLLVHRRLSVLRPMWSKVGLLVCAALRSTVRGTVEAARERDRYYIVRCHGRNLDFARGAAVKPLETAGCLSGRFSYERKARGKSRTRAGTDGPACTRFMPSMTRQNRPGAVVFGSSGWVRDNQNNGGSPLPCPPVIQHPLCRHDVWTHGDWYLFLFLYAPLQSTKLPSAPFMV